MNLRVSDVAEYLSSSFEGTDRVISKIVIDSREVKRGDLFLAISGINNDGHKYITDAIDKGAACIILSLIHI